MSYVTIGKITTTCPTSTGTVTPRTTSASLPSTRLTPTHGPTQELSVYTYLIVAVGVVIVVAVAMVSMAVIIIGVAYIRHRYSAGGFR